MPLDLLVGPVPLLPGLRPLEARVKPGSADLGETLVTAVPSHLLREEE